MAELDPGIAKLLADIEKSTLPRIWELPVTEAREAAHKGNQINNGPIPPGATLTQVEIPSPHGPLPVRLYRPKEQLEGKILPLLLYFHGGGWVINSAQDLDVPNILLCQAADCLIASVDYRLAPEHPFPKGLEDVFTTLQWAQQNAGEWGADPKRIAVAGDSAGGNLAAVVAHLNRDQGGPDLSFQLLIYPNTDIEGDYPSRKEFGKGYNLEWVGMQWFTDQYAPDPKEHSNPKMSPIRSESFSGLPPALVITAGFDPLQDEGKAYIPKLQQAGIPVQHEHFASMIHGFYLMRGRSPVVVDQAIALCGAALKKAFEN